MKFTVEKDYENMAVGDYLRKMKGISRRLLNKVKNQNLLYVNNTPVWANHIIKADDLIKITFPISNSQNIIAENLNIKIIYEDNDFLVLDKPYNMPPHPSKGHFMGTLANFVKYHYEKNGISTAVRILGRLDKDTSGVVIVCKNQHIQNKLSKLNYEKIYFAICEGVFENKKGIIDLPIARSLDGIKREVNENGKKALTEYEVTEEKCGYSLVKIKLITGRTHQIRVHMSHIGHPLLGDFLYGNDSCFHRQALHAHMINIPEFSFISPLSDDMKKFWDNL